MTTGLITDIALDVGKSLVDNLLSSLVGLSGLDAEIYFPTEGEEVANPYKPFDNLSIIYDSIPSASGTYLFLGDIIGRRFPSDDTIDNYTANEIYMLTASGSVVEQDSKVVISLATKKYPFRVDKVQVAYSKDVIMYQKSTLVPMSIG